VLGLGVGDRLMHFLRELCCCPNLPAFVLPFLPLADLVIQSGDELEDLRVVVLTNMSSSVVLAVCEAFEFTDDILQYLRIHSSDSGFWGIATTPSHYFLS
jgi:hypothetical protein